MGMDLREKFLQKFISNEDGPVKSTETRQGGKCARLPYYGMMAERKTRRLPYICCTYSRCRVVLSFFPPSFCSRVVFLCLCLPVLFLYFLQVRLYWKQSFAKTSPQFLLFFGRILTNFRETNILEMNLCLAL